MFNLTFQWSIDIEKQNADFCRESGRQSSADLFNSKMTTKSFPGVENISKFIILQEFKVFPWSEIVIIYWIWVGFFPTSDFQNIIWKIAWSLSKDHKNYPNMYCVKLRKFIWKIAWKSFKSTQKWSKFVLWEIEKIIYLFSQVKI